MDTQIVGNIMSATVGAGVSALASLYIYRKKMKTEEPNLCFGAINGSFKIEKDENKENLMLKLKILFENKGNSSISITDIVTSIRYSKETAKYNLIPRKLVCSERPLDNFTPIEISPYGSKLEEFNFEYRDVYSYFLDRCGVPFDFSNPKKWEWKDLPIVINIIAKTPTRNLDTKTCIFREDLEESKKVRGSLDFDLFDFERDFAPKLDQN